MASNLTNCFIVLSRNVRVNPVSTQSGQGVTAANLQLVFTKRVM